jgi:hypothetical protein
VPAPGQCPTAGSQADGCKQVTVAVTVLSFAPVYNILGWTIRGKAG